jgi:hypothetical protein
VRRRRARKKKKDTDRMSTLSFGEHLHEDEKKQR